MALSLKSASRDHRACHNTNTIEQTSPHTTPLITPRINRHTACGRERHGSHARLSAMAARLRALLLAGPGPPHLRLGDMESEEEAERIWCVRVASRCSGALSALAALGSNTRAKRERGPDTHTHTRRSPACADTSRTPQNPLILQAPVRLVAAAGLGAAVLRPQAGAQELALAASDCHRSLCRQGVQRRAQAGETTAFFVVWHQ